jgi:uncharacterized RDD family membrane protein YckC
MARNCPSCSTQNIDGARFCRTCGTVLQPSSPTPPRSVVDSTPFQPDYPPQYQSPNQYPSANPTSTISPISTAPNYGSPVQPYYPVQDRVTYPLAGFGSRFGAYFIDGLIAGAIFLPGYIYFLSTGGGQGNGNPLAALIMLLGLAGQFGFILFNTYLQGTSGATVGKKIVGLKVLDQYGQPLGFGKSFLRELVKFVLANVCFLIFLTMIWDTEKQCLHDKVANSHVYEA